MRSRKQDSTNSSAPTPDSPPAPSTGEAPPPESPGPQLRRCPPQSPQANAFDTVFLDHLEEREEDFTSAEAAVAGPWWVIEVPQGWAVCGEGSAEPELLAPEREVALLAAAALPASGRPGRFALGDADERPFPLLDRHAGGEPVGELAFFSPEVTDLMSALDAVLRSPRSLAQLCLAAGAENLRQVGRILVRELSERSLAG